MSVDIIIQYSKGALFTRCMVYCLQAIHLVFIVVTDELLVFMETAYCFFNKDT